MGAYLDGGSTTEQALQVLVANAGPLVSPGGRSHSTDVAWVHAGQHLPAKLPVAVPGCCTAWAVHWHISAPQVHARRHSPTDANAGTQGRWKLSDAGEHKSCLCAADCGSEVNGTPAGWLQNVMQAQRP